MTSDNNRTPWLVFITVILVLQWTTRLSITWLWAATYDPLRGVMSCLLFPLWAPFQYRKVWQASAPASKCLALALLMAVPNLGANYWEIGAAVSSLSLLAWTIVLSAKQQRQ